VQAALAAAGVVQDALEGHSLHLIWRTLL